MGRRSALVIVASVLAAAGTMAAQGNPPQSNPPQQPSQQQPAPQANRTEQQRERGSQMTVPPGTAATAAERAHASAGASAGRRRTEAWPAGGRKDFSHASQRAHRRPADQLHSHCRHLRDPR